MNYQKGIIFTVFSAATFALTPLVVLKAYEHGATPWEIIFTQSIIASLILGLGLFIFSPQNLKVSKKELKNLTPIGLVGSLGTVVCYNLSLQYISGGLATLLLYTYPVFVAMGTILIWGQKYSGKQVLALFSGIVGVGLAARIVEINQVQINSYGLILGLLAALAYTILNLYSEKALATISPWKVTAYAQFGSTVGLLLIINIFPGLMAVGEIKPIYWLYGAGVSIVCSIIPTFLLMKGIAYIGSSRASIVSTAEIPITLLLVFLFLGERFTILQLIGSALVFLSVLILRNEGEANNLPA